MFKKIGYILLVLSGGCLVTSLFAGIGSYMSVTGESYGNWVSNLLLWAKVFGVLGLVSLIYNGIKYRW